MTEQSKPTKASRRRGKRKGKSPFGGPRARVDSSVRHQGRILAMQSLYERDVVSRDPDDIVSRFQHDTGELPASAVESMDADESVVDDIPTPVAKHAIRLINGVLEHEDAINGRIARAAPQFPIEQLAVVDRNVLRLAVYELDYVPDVPYKVAINEAVEIAKRFGGPNSGRFVNGVLGTIERTRAKPETGTDSTQGDPDVTGE